MNKPTHTPGPWSGGEFDPAGDWIGVYAGPDDAVIVCEVLIQDVSLEEAEANARLIKAAPALLEACRDALLTRACDRATRDKIRAAVALATLPEGA